MVCDRCIMVVKAELEKLGFNPIAVKLGEVEISENDLSEPEMAQINAVMNQLGFEVLSAKKEQLVMQIKSELIALVHHGNENLKVNLSAHLSEKLNVSYANLSAVFSELTNHTIEKYFIEQKIESAKELLTYGEKSLSEIAYQLNYSSVAHLSAQFKKVTGLTPSAYKSAHHRNRKTLDQI